MKKKWKKIMAVWCAATMLMTMPGTSALADEMADEAIITVAEDPYPTVDVVDSLDEGDTDVEVPAEEVSDEEDVAIEAETVDQENPEEMLSAGDITVGDNVTATFDSSTGAVKFYSNSGTLWKDWVEKIGVEKTKITSLKIASGKVYLPKDSSNIFALGEGDGFVHDSSLKELDLSGFDTSRVTNMSEMFLGCGILTELDLRNFNTSKVTNMSGMFKDCRELTELDLSSFDTSNVTDMSYMFSANMAFQVYHLKRLNLESFNTSKVKNMSYMFYGCYEMPSLDLSNFDTSNVTDMSYMFNWCQNLTSLNIKNFVTSNVSNMVGMFSECYNLTDLDVSGFDTSNVTNMGIMFSGCRSLTKLDVSSFDTSNVTDMGGMFSECRGLTKLDVSSFETSNVTRMHGMFSSCANLTNLDLSKFDTSKVNIMRFMFSGCTNLKSLNLSNFSISNVEDMGEMFEACSSLESLDLSSFNKSLVPVSMHMMFYECSSLKNVNLRGFDTSNVTSMGGMFYRCSSLTSLDLSSFDTSNVTYMAGMFSGCSSLTSLDLSSFDTSNLIDMQAAFEGCSSLSSLDISSFDTSNLKGELATYNVFLGCSKLELLKTPKKQTIADIALPYNMYDSAGKVYTELPLLSKSIVLTKSTSIQNCSITLSSTSYTYDGKEKKPAVTVQNGSIILSNNTDYKVTYSNNVNAGTATVTVTGAGSYTGTAAKTFTIAKATPALSFANSSVSKKNGDAAFTNALTKTTDGTVTFSSSNTGVATVNSTSGQVTVKGVGQTTITATAAEGKNYKAGSASYTLTVVNVSTVFTWAKDNWNFTNSSSAGYFDNGQYVNQINSHYKAVLANNLTNIEYQYIFDPRSGWLYDKWAGSCYGMSALVHLSKAGILPYADYQSGATCLYNLKYPKANEKVSSLITYYQMIQVKDPIQYQYRTVPSKTQKENISRIISLLQTNNTVLVGFEKSGWGGHAILAYGYEYGSYTWNGVTYQGCIKICDPNASTGYNKNYNIYYNTSSYNWTIPGYSNMTSTKGARFNYIGADASEINNGGYLNGNKANNTNGYVARIDAAAISDNRSITKVRNVNGNYTALNNATDDIVEADSFVLGSSNSTGTAGYNLYDADSSYRVSQESAEELKLRMDYGTMSLRAESAAGRYAIFDKKAYVEVAGESADYLVGMTLNDNYPTKWFTVEASGSGANKASMLKTSQGYLLSSDNLKNVTVKANNRDEWVDLTFTTAKKQALICQSGSGELDVKVDNDNNGTFETSVKNTKKGFSDVQDPSHPYYKAIYWAAGEGITKGYSDGTFGINRSCTRGEMMMFLWRYAGKPAPKNVSKSPFKDVPKTHTFYKAILWGSQKGITKGYSDGTFGINRNVSRGECMMFLWRLKGKPAPKAVAKAPFPDVPKSHVFYNAVLWGYQKKITTGFTSGKLKGKFGVNENCSRGQIVTFLYRAK